jgi:hypothetical protein
MKKFFESLHISPAEWRLTTLFFILAVFSKGIALFSLGYATDDYKALGVGAGEELPYAKGSIAQGRFIGFLLVKYSDKLGVGSAYAAGIYGMLFLAAILLSGLIIVRLWRLEGNLWCTAIVIGFLSAYPYLTEYFCFKLSYLSLAVVFLLTFVALKVCSGKPLPFAMSCVAMIAALAPLQPCRLLCISV